MIRVILGIIALLVGLIVFVRSSTLTSQSSGGRYGAVLAILGGKLGGALLVLAGLFLMASTSFVYIDANRVGHLKRIYAFSELPSGRIIALAGEKGPQARILGPGFHFEPFINVLYQVEERPVITIPKGYYGEITALDGNPMPEGMFIAPKFEDAKVAEMLNASKFLTSDRGYRGPQETVLTPGSYRLNQYLFRVNFKLDETRATIVPAGHVGVVKSNVRQPGAKCDGKKTSTIDGSDAEGALSVPLVPKGCVGIWSEPLQPGAYYLNRQAYEITLVDTRVRTWVYKGGYVKRNIDLSLDQQGNVKQVETRVDQPIPPGAADRAVFAKIETWDIPLELRAVVQIPPKNAPIVVGSVGGINEVEDRILTPAIRSIVRNVAGGTIRVPVKQADGTVKLESRPTRALDLIFNRDAIEQRIEQLIKVEGRKAGVEIKEIRLGEPALPPELLLGPKRLQLANELKQTYEREKEAAAKRAERERERATADEQPRLVAAQIAVAVAQQREKEREALGRAERRYLEELAKGQLAQATVLGKDRVALLQALEKVLSSLEKKPELVQLVSRLVPHTVVGGGGDGGLAGAAAILGGAFNRGTGSGAEKK